MTMDRPMRKATVGLRGVPCTALAMVARTSRADHVITMALDDDVREGQLLYLLATEPAQALPPGKSLLSALTRPPPTPTPSRLEAQVSEIVHKAFWDEARVPLIRATDT